MSTINNPSKTVTASFSVASDITASSTANITKSYTFAGWNISNMDSSTHTLGSASNTSTSTTATEIKGTTFRNLRLSAGAVSFTAKWTPPSITLPTITKTGYSCQWVSDSYTYASGGTYSPADTQGATARTFTASCTANPIAMTTQNLNDGTCLTAYTSNSFDAATGGTGSYTYTIVSGAPEGATIDSANRKISFPATTKKGTYQVVVKATDNKSGKTAQGIKTIKIKPKDGYVTLSRTLASITYGDDSYSFTITSNHGGTLSVSDDNNSATCSISGTTVTCTNLKTISAAVDVNITVACSETGYYMSAQQTLNLNINKATPTVTVSISGKTKIGSKLTASASSVSSGSKSYQWYYSNTKNNTSGVYIPGATSSTYTIPASISGYLASTKGYYFGVYVTVAETTNYYQGSGSKGLSSIAFESSDVCALETVSQSLMFGQTCKQRGFEKNYKPGVNNGTYSGNCYDAAGNYTYGRYTWSIIYCGSEEVCAKYGYVAGETLYDTIRSENNCTAWLSPNYWCTCPD